MIAGEPKKCVECGEPLRLEMEQDGGICVDCQSEKALTLEELEESCADLETLLNETMEGNK